MESSSFWSAAARSATHGMLAALVVVIVVGVSLHIINLISGRIESFPGE